MINSENSMMQLAEFNTTVFDFDFVFIQKIRYVWLALKWCWIQQAVSRDTALKLNIWRAFQKLTRLF